METVLNMLKTDLGINHNKRDTYFINLIESCKGELKAKGISLNTTIVEDIMLLSDYSAWTYRKRTEDIPLSQNLQLRIRNRIMKGRASNV